ncbi:hypothetical protein [Phenylobacterium sp.]|uniref:hypothetical protein n=1 Tax=Phenylobacterium sp. TaxID=1871053 RepID=UPI002F3E8E0C
MAASAPVLTLARADPSEVRAVIATALDGDFYRTLNVDLPGGLDIVRHYAESGWREGRDPAPWFCTAAYAAAYPELVKAGWNPFHHYLTRGRYEGREVARSPHADDYLLRRARRGEAPAWSFGALVGGGQTGEAVADETETRMRERRLTQPEFDTAFYLAANPDVAKGGSDPLDHFLSTGWREGRDPSATFSVKDYLESYPDIAAAEVNPFVHFLSAGRAEGRSGKTDLGFRYDILKALVPPDARVAAVIRASARLKLGAGAQLAKGLAAARTGLSDLHITFSHDDYVANTGGVQLCLQREDARIAALGRDHLHLFPAKPWPVVRTKADVGQLGVLLNGKALGAYAPKTVAQALGKAAGAVKPGKRSFAIHSLLGHAAGETADILAAAGLSAGYFWLHDFASLCAGFHLMRNDVEDCAAPPADSQACGVCVYGPWRARHEAEHARLFERLSLTVVSPARPTLDLWAARSAYPAAATVVLPHARLVPKGAAFVPPAERPLRVAFAGMPAAHKGWEIFHALAEAHATDPRYHFLHLGGRAPAGSKIEFHKVTVTEASPLAMRDALIRHEADLVVMWPLCRETFSFAAYEAVAAGAAVVTGPDSGNIAAFVADGGHGQVLADEAALSRAFASGEIAELSRAARKPQVYDLAFSGLTVDLLEGVG